VVRFLYGANGLFSKKIFQNSKLKILKTKKNKISDFKFKKIKIFKNRKNQKLGFFRACACVKAKNLYISVCVML